MVETIRREAARYGCAITKSELVGLTPQEALIDAAQWYLQLDMFESHQILENKLREALSGQAQSIIPNAFHRSHRGWIGHARRRRSRRVSGCAVGRTGRAWSRA